PERATRAADRTASVAGKTGSERAGDRRLHAQRYPGGIAQAGPRPARTLRSPSFPGERERDRRLTTRYDARGRSDECNEVRGLRGRGRPSGWPRAHQRTGGPLHQGAFGRGQGGAVGEGTRSERGCQDETDCAFHENASSKGRKISRGVREEAG